MTRKQNVGNIVRGATALGFSIGGLTIAVLNRGAISSSVSPYMVCGFGILAIYVFLFGLV